MEAKLIKLGTDLLVVIIPILAGFLVELLRRKLGVEKMQRIQKELEAKQELARLAVQFVQQFYRGFEGSQKYEQAAQWLAQEAGKHGLSIGEEEIKGLIEASLKGLKAEFGEQWADVMKG